MGLFNKAKKFAASQVDKAVDSKTAELIDLQEQIDDARESLELGLVRTEFQFETVDEYKSRLSELRAEQKEFCRDLLEKTKSNTKFTHNNSISKGRKMVCDIQKLIIRGFNAECDDYVRKVKTSNAEQYKEKIEKSAAVYSKLGGSVLNLIIPRYYVKLKLEELDIAYEYALFKEEEKEKARELREQQREEMKLKKEIEEQRKKLEKERTQYQKALSDAKKQLEESGPTPELEQKISDLEANLSEVEHGISDVDYREANQRAGYVYVISNIGAFGEDVYKIGMTRRLDPMERVRELGDASVPFTFDIHALIFSDDAPSLEAALHREFDDRRVNMVNNRREFFRVSLDEIKEVVKKNYDKTVEFFDEPDAEQYRMSQAIIKQRA